MESHHFKIYFVTCGQQSLWSACAGAQADQSLLWPHKEFMNPRICAVRNLSLDSDDAQSNQSQFFTVQRLWSQDWRATLSVNKQLLYQYINPSNLVSVIVYATVQSKPIDLKVLCDFKDEQRRIIEIILFNYSNCRTIVKKSVFHGVCFIHITSLQS